MSRKKRTDKDSTEHILQDDNASSYAIKADTDALNEQRSKLVKFGKSVFNNDESKFKRWMRKPNLALGKRKPESLLNTTNGIDAVLDVLGRIKHGIYS